ncbi:acyltransferase [Croceibacterium sp. TMG7-5b_MA50]|uniref:acyltransferase family protein n=1 Tax=Croceibacterium sp. TMG7-5b_MA50 TaxID=3121290 RepID=UPI0032221F27
MRTMTADQDARAHYPQLDGLRCFAVLGVLITHYWLQSSWFGHLGVRLFFVLSGFLITGILLDEHAEGRPARIGASLAAFYARRVLRLFPTYYLMLAVGLAFRVEGVRETIWYHATFLSNLWYARQPDWEPWATVHLWTLAVEEQFYLGWPLLILLLPRRWLRAAMLATIVAALLFRHLMELIWPDMPPQDVLTPAMMDALALGGLVALAVRDRPGDGGRQHLLQWLGGASLIALAVLSAQYVFHPLPYAVNDFLRVIPMAFLVLAARHGLPGPAGAVLGSGPVRYVGRVSYGLYIWHLFAWVLVSHIDPTLLDPGFRVFLITTPVAIAFGAASWHLVERPCNRLKRLFPYRLQAAAAA